jgi:hypothetical protein
MLNATGNPAVVGEAIATVHSISSDVEATQTTPTYQPTLRSDGGIQFDGTNDGLVTNNSGQGAGDFYYYYKGTLPYVGGVFFDGSSSVGGKRWGLYTSTTYTHLEIHIDDDIDFERIEIYPKTEYDLSDIVEIEFYREDGIVYWNIHNLTKETETSGSEACTIDYSSEQPFTIGCYFLLGETTPSRPSNITVYELKAGRTI